jgi:predicted RNA-binding Zn-ribbon protein involved in translation (DUF1610 family)
VIHVTCPSCNGSFKTSDDSAGKTAKCPNCGGLIEIPAPIGEEVYDAEIDEVESTSPEDAHSLDQEDRMSCPMCGEMIKRGAAKCRYCGEIFDPILKAQTAKLSSSEGRDADLSFAEWMVAILCSGIGCIFGIVWIIQGKPKGTKMLLVSLGMQFFWFLVQLAIQSANQR